MASWQLQTRAFHTSTEGQMLSRKHICAIKRTLAGLGALRPGVVKLRVAVVSTLIEPSTARSATTDFAGFLESGTLGACGRRSGLCCCLSVGIQT